MCDPWDSQGNEKNAVSISIAFCLDFLMKSENITSEECKTKKPFEIILHVGRVTSLQSWVAKKAYNSPYMQYYFKRFFVLHSSKVIFSFLIEKSKQKAIEIEIAFFIPLGIPRVAHWIISFMLHISAITAPKK